MLKKLPSLDVEGPPGRNPPLRMLKVDGPVEEPVTFSREDILALEATEATAPIVCVEGRDMWVKWKGIRLSWIVRHVRPKPEAKWPTLYAYSEYTDSPSMKDAMDDRTMLAYGLNGQYLPAENGGPLRLAVPFMLAYETVKRLARISFVESEKRGYREIRGYPPEAGIDLEKRMQYGL
jgi:DMSO/TMAO reductase YedYZ molybdopterin-dependent catalytic subunit